MNKPIYNFFTDDHRRVEQILLEAIADIDNIKPDLYEAFRVGLMTHIKMEEKVLFLAAQEANDGQPLPIAAQLRLEHGAITTLLSVPPNPTLIKVLAYVLQKHDLREEEPGGMYDACEALTANQTDELLQRLRAVSDVPTRPLNPLPMVFETAKRTLQRAGYDYDEIADMPIDPKVLL
jgi:hypothetical protein